MVGPSSSHTAGAVHLGLFARALLHEEPIHADIGLHGSFNYTGEGHGTHLALLSGILGFATDDERIPLAKQIAAAAGLTYIFFPLDFGEAHPNSVRIQLASAGDQVIMCGSSIGGGKISIWEINHHPVELAGDYPTLLLVHHDYPGVIANVSGLLSQFNLNIAAMKVYRAKRGGEALMSIELDQEPHDDLLPRLLALPDIYEVRFIPKISDK